MMFTKYIEGSSAYYRYNEKLSNGQTISMTFQVYGDCINVYLDIYTKRKKIAKAMVNKYITGKCGLESLYTAKIILELFISEVKSRSLMDDIKSIIVSASDKRRGAIYKRYLKDLGFQSRNDGSCDYLVLKI